MAMDYLAPERDFHTLSLKDLLDARDQYHLHLMHKKNVVATAVGLYRIRRTDPWPQRPSARPAEKKEGERQQAKDKKTLDNTEVRDYSWPCVLVFVKEWVDPRDFGVGAKAKAEAIDAVPWRLHLRDGRIVPVCVVEAPRDTTEQEHADNMVFPDTVIGGGYPVLADAQGQEQLASIGCLVTDGHTVYALTNRHVAGEPGETLYSILRGNRVAIGRSSHKQLGRKPFEEVYPGWAGRDVFVNLDIGLIEIDDLDRWTAQVYGVGKLNEVADLSSENLSLKLIRCPVRAYGCASRDMRGEVQALFYRYKSLGGFEYVADFLIGPRRDPETGEFLPFSTDHGDSGTLWVLDTADPVTNRMPIAVQWGGQVFTGPDEKARNPCALATCLSTVCNELGVDLVRDWSIGHDEYWGAVGHLSIAALACCAVGDAQLKELMQANLPRISFALPDITKKGSEGLSKKDFVPLSDVPDLVWKMLKVEGCRGKSAEGPNHFADMDRPRPSDKKTLLQLCKEDPANLSIPVWQDYYEEVKDKSKGILPFRVQQIFEEMCRSAQTGERDRFVCAAGILAHYVADACQPLHISYLYDGDPDGEKKEEDGKDVPIGRGVHEAFDSDMVGYNVTEIKTALPDVMKLVSGPPCITTGPEAARATVDLMERSLNRAKPRDVLKLYEDNAGLSREQMADALWGEFGGAMKKVMADGCRTLAMFWESAWSAGNGKITDLSAVDPEALRKLYRGKAFLKSCTIKTISQELAKGSP